jgi:hypothetical protein
MEDKLLKAKYFLYTNKEKSIKAITDRLLLESTDIHYGVERDISLEERTSDKKTQITILLDWVLPKENSDLKSIVESMT